MCTLILGRDLPAPGQILIAANRDEDPARPSEPPRVLREIPRLVGGRDVVAGGTWLAVRAGVPTGPADTRIAGRWSAPAAVMLLNRPPLAGRPPGRRSRGLLVMDVVAADDPLLAARDAGRGTEANPAAGDPARWSDYGPCTLVFASPESCWLMALPGDGPARMAEISPGWHVITHAELDDPREPRTAWLVERLRGLAPRSAEHALDALARLLAQHGTVGNAGDAASPAVCIHGGRMPTVSASLVLLSRERVLYRHANGRPCEHAFADQGSLLEQPAPAPPGPRP